MAIFRTRTAWRGYRLGWSLLTGLTWWSLLGCGAPEYKSKALPLEGFVQWEKGPTVTELEGGSLEFEKDGAVAATAALTGDGSFRLATALSPGKYRVRVVPPANPLRKGPELDPSVQRFETSGLEFTATSEPGQVTFQLKKRRR
jgi:hypothetical protein